MLKHNRALHGLRTTLKIFLCFTGLSDSPPKNLIIMQTTNLKLLRELRTQEKALKAQIDSISDAATTEAVAILAAEGKDRGEFTIPGVGTFQLQRTDVFDFADYNKYKQEQAVKWRENAREKVKEQNLVKARTALMNGYVKTFVELYPDKQPDDIKLTVKIID